MDWVRLCSSIIKENLVSNRSVGFFERHYPAYARSDSSCLTVNEKKMELCIIDLRENINKVIRKGRRMLWKISRIILKEIKIGWG